MFFLEKEAKTILNVCDKKNYSIFALSIASQAWLGFQLRECGSSSVGRAQPCQGWGRGSESRLPLFFLVARMAELVDAQDLKSCDHCDCAGSIPAPGTNKI